MDERIDPAACIFCKIVAGEAPCERVAEDARTLAFMDIAPVTDGHTLVIPKAHGHNLLDCDPADLEAVIVQSRRVAHAIRAVFAPEGIGVFQLNGTAAGQTVFHYHMHLIPRRAGEPLQLHGRKPGDTAQLADNARRLANAL